MNFIGHATVGLWRAREPRFVLGCMLPDFATMAGARLAPIAAGSEGPLGSLAEGVALHHRTDEVFHAAPAFTALMHETLEQLRARGVARGSARAVGHIGVEMLIDGELVHEPEVADAYTAALHAGRGLERAFADAEGEQRFERLRQRLLAWGAPYDYRDPSSVLVRLSHVLRGRPRLALDPGAAPVVLAILPALQRAVVRALPALLASVRAELGAHAS